VPYVSQASTNTLNQGIFVLAVILVAWWAVGGITNRRRANRIIAAMRPLIRGTGQVARIRWHGPSAFHIEVSETRGGIRALAILVLLTARESPFTWAWALWRHYRDLLVLEADFTRTPSRTRTVTVGESGRDLPPGWSLRLQPKHPHLHLTAPLPAAPDAVLREAFRLLGEYAAAIANRSDPSQADPAPKA